MNYELRTMNQKAQTTIEYMLLLAVVVAAVFIGFKMSLPQMRTSANTYFNRTAIGILGNPNPCGDNICDIDFERPYPDKCPIDCSCPGPPCP